MTAYQGVIDDIRITCAACGECHSIFMGCATQVPADIPLDQAIAEMHRIADRQRAGLKAAGVVMVDDDAGNQIAIR